MAHLRVDDYCLPDRGIAEHFPPASPGGTPIFSHYGLRAGAFRRRAFVFSLAIVPVVYALVGHGVRQGRFVLPLSRGSADILSASRAVAARLVVIRLCSGNVVFVA